MSNHVTSGDIEALFGEMPGLGSPRGCWKVWCKCVLIPRPVLFPGCSFSDPNTGKPLVAPGVERDFGREMGSRSTLPWPWGICLPLGAWPLPTRAQGGHWVGIGLIEGMSERMTFLMER